MKYMETQESIKRTNFCQLPKSSVFCSEWQCFFCQVSLKRLRLIENSSYVTSNTQLKVLSPWPVYPNLPREIICLLFEDHLHLTVSTKENRN